MIKTTCLKCGSIEYNKFNIIRECCNTETKWNIFNPIMFNKCLDMEYKKKKGFKTAYKATNK